VSLVQPVSSATFAATFSANPTYVLIPVPTAVPPAEQNKLNRDWDEYTTLATVPINVEYYAVQHLKPHKIAICWGRGMQSPYPESSFQHSTTRFLPYNFISYFLRSRILLEQVWWNSSNYDRNNKEGLNWQMPTSAHNNTVSDVYRRRQYVKVRTLVNVPLTRKTTPCGFRGLE